MAQRDTEELKNKSVNGLLIFCVAISSNQIMALQMIKNTRNQRFSGHNHKVDWMQRGDFAGCTNR
jgi:hypothetical protein